MANPTVYQNNLELSSIIDKLALDKIIELVKEWRTSGKYGFIQVNFRAGEIIGINLNESVIVAVKQG